MLLASVDGLREFLGFDDMTDISNAITTAIDLVESQMSALLNTDFGIATYSDFFYVYRPSTIGGRHEQVEFRLSAGLLSAAPVVDVATNMDYFDTPAMVAITPGRVDLAKGIVSTWGGASGCSDLSSLIGGTLRNSYVRIGYTAGFAVDPNDATSYDLTMVPDWVQSAARLKALAHLADLPMLTEAGIKLDKPTLDKQFAAVINRHQRYAPAAILPL